MSKDTESLFASHAAVVRDTLSWIHTHPQLSVEFQRDAEAALDALVAERDEALLATARVREAHGDLVASTMVPLVRGGTFRDVLDRCEKLEAALRTIQDYYESVYAPGDQAYQAAIVARAALKDAG